jgi:hypothetical protein
MARKRVDTVKLVLRLPPALHQRLGRAAARSNQSLNSEMIRRLEQSFELPKQAEALAQAVRDAAHMAMVDLGESAAMTLIGVEEQLAKMGGSELVLSVGEKRYRFVTEDKIEEIKNTSGKKDSES